MSYKKGIKVLGIVLLVLALAGVIQMLIAGGWSGDLLRYLLPVTLPSKVTFVNETNNEPIKGVAVRFTWEGSRGNAGGYGGGWTYFENEKITDENGSVNLPMRTKPFPVLFIPIYFSGHDAINISMATWKYMPRKYLKNYDPYSKIVSIFGTEKAPIIRVKQLTTADEQLSQLESNASIYGKVFWDKGITDIISAHGLSALSTQSLSLIADTCVKYKESSCEVFDKEVLRRNGNDTKDYSSRKSAIRLGIVTPEMEQRLKSWEERRKAGHGTSISENEEIAEIRRIYDSSKRKAESPTRQ